MGDKIATMAEAAALIPDGANLSLGGFAHGLCPLAFVRELIRQGPRNLVLTSMGEGWAADYLCGAGMLKTVLLSNYMFEGFGRCRNFSRAVETGALQVEDYSHFGITSRLYAGALGIPFLPVKVMSGSDIAKISTLREPKLIEFTSPFDDEKVILVPKSQPDFAVIHASRADSEGNVQIFGFKSVIDEQARAAKTVIVTVEEIVPSSEIRRHPEFTILPSFLVDVVVEAPFGAHPGGMYGYYDYDPAHIAVYWEASKSQDTFNAYLDEYVYGVKDNIEYLEKIGIARLMQLRVDPALGYSLAVRGERNGRLQ